MKDFVNETGFAKAWDANDKIHTNLSRAGKFIALTNISITFASGDDFDKFGAMLDGATMVAGKIAGIGEMTGFYAKVYTASRKAIDGIDNKIIDNLNENTLNNCENLLMYVEGGKGTILNGIGLAMGIRTKGY